MQVLTNKEAFKKMKAFLFEGIKTIK